MKSQSYHIQENTSERLALTALTGLAFLFVFLSPMQALLRVGAVFIVGAGSQRSFPPTASLGSVVPILQAQEDPATDLAIELARQVIPGLERALPQVPGA